jgi:hypothetical protein
MMDFEKLDLKLKLLSGDSIEADKGAGMIEPLSMKEMIRYGYTDYLMKLHFITMDMNDILEGSSEEDNPLGLNMFDVLVHYGSDDMKSELENSLILFFKTTRININTEEHVIYIGESDELRIIDRDNFEKVREVIKWQNCLKKFDDDEDSNEEESDAVKRIREKLNKGKDLVNIAKREDDEGEGIELDISDIISAVSSKSNALNKLNVFDLTLFQLYDEFKRLELIEQYDIGIKSMLAGAKDVKLKHWSTKID